MKSWIYAIKDVSDVVIYVGSCSRKYFCQRKGDHVKPSNQKKNTSLLQYVNGKGGWEGFRFEILKEYDTIPHEELLQSEKKYIEELLPLCNMNRPITTQEERNASKRITGKVWRQKNPEKTKLQRERARTTSSYKVRTNKRCMTKIQCPCGGVYSLQNKTNHYNRNIHKQYEITQNNQVSESQEKMESNL